MRNKTVDTSAKCPYYKADGKQSIHCEGIEPDCGLHLGFGSLQRLHDYKLEFCRGGWHGCRVAGMLNSKHGYQPPEA